MAGKRIYLAYGSNLNKRQMEFRCPTAKAVGTAMIEDWRLVFKGSMTGAYLTIEPHEGSKVPVALWEIEPADEKSLDSYEGYPRFYIKKDFKINDMDCFAYIMNEEREYGLPTEGYVAVCGQGYKDFNFNIKYLKQAVVDTTEELCFEV